MPRYQERIPFRQLHTDLEAPTAMAPRATEAISDDCSGGPLAPELAERVQAQRGGGAPMEPATQQRMEDGFGHNFADVRIHADGESDMLNRGMGARAFTLGSDIFLSQEAGNTAADDRDRLLAHELTHVVQQRGAAQASPLTVGAIDDPYEREATAIADEVSVGNAASGVLAGSRAQVGVAPLRVQRQGGGKGEPTVTSLAKDVKALKKKDEARDRDDLIRDNKLKALNLDQLWRAQFGEQLSSYKQAVWAITQGIQTANSKFEGAQAAQAQTDQLWAQLFAGIATVTFAAGFEWVFTGLLGGLGRSARAAEAGIGKLATKAEERAFGKADLGLEGTRVQSMLETGENPANAVIASAGNVNAASTAIDSAGQGKTPAAREAAGDPFTLSSDPVIFLSSNMQELESHSQAMEKAFFDRAWKMESVGVYDWANFDADLQKKVYNDLLVALQLSGSGIERLKPVEQIAIIFEKRLWAYWLKSRSDFTRAVREGLADMDGGNLLRGLHELTAPNLVAVMPSLGSDIEQRLNALGVADEAGVGLSGHFYESNSFGWGAKLANWANTYISQGDTIVK